MKTRINLYRDEFKPQFVWVSATNALIFSLFTLLLMAGIYFAVWQERESRLQELAEINKSIQEKQSKLSQLTTQLAQRKKDPVLLSKLSKQQTRLSTAKHLADKLESLSARQEDKFSSALTSFAEINSSSVWLTSFKVNGSNITIEGNISNPGALPAWLQAIGKTDYFQNRYFRTATVIRTEEQLSFKIESIGTDEQEKQGEANE
jgi:Tfp pilus assembly protein PilN